MARPLKYFAIAFGSLLLLLILVIGGLLLFVDPNTFKPQIITAVKQKTGMDLTLDEKLGWTLWPSIGVKLGKLTLSDPALHEQLLAVNSAAVSVQLLPLLSSKVEVDAVTLDGAAVRYVQYADGSTSWDHMLTKLKNPNPQADTSSSGGKTVSLSVKQLAISNSSLTLVDDKTKTTRAVTGLDVQASSIAIDRDFPLAVKFAFDQTSAGSALSTQSSLSTTLHVNPAFDHIVLHGLKVDTSLTGGGGNLALPESVSLQANIDADLAQKQYKIDQLALSADYKPMVGKAFTIGLTAGINANLRDGIFAVSPLSLAVLDLKADGALKAAVPALAASAKPGTAITSGMTLTGNIATNTFNPRALLDAFNIELPTTTDAAALSHLSLRSDLAGSEKSLLLKNIHIVLDASTLSGEAGVSDLQSMRLYANLNLDKINADGYMPPASPATAPAAAAPVGDDDGLLPVKLLRQQNLDVTLGVGSASALGYSIAPFHLAATANGGLVTVSDFRGNIYGGSFSFPSTVDVRGAQPALGVKPVVNNIEVGPVAQKLLKKDLFTGKINLTGALTMQGNSVDAWKRSLGGNVTFNFGNGVMHGVNMMQLVMDGVGKYANVLALDGKNAAGVVSSQSDTPIGQLDSQAIISNGLVNQTMIKADLQKAQLNGTGTFNLVSLDADYHLQMNLDRSVLGPRFAGYSIPVGCKGNVATPAKLCGIDGSTLRDLALKSVTSQQLEKLGVPAGDVGSAIAQKKEAVKQQVQQQLNNRLQGLFGH